MQTSGTQFSFTTSLALCVAMIMLVLSPVQGARYGECDCYVYAKGEVCPGSTFQFEQKNWHGYCESRGKDPNSGSCKCYNCDSCNLVNQADYRRKRSVLQPEYSYLESSSQLL